MKTTTGCSADYTAGYDEGYKQGFIAGDKHAQMHEQARKGLLPVYQGLNVLCAHCGDPIPDGDGIQGTPDWKGEVFLFCDAECRGGR
jgi:hypothetical protein